MHWLCVYFPQLSLDRVLQAGEDPTPTAVHDGGPKPRIVACNDPAQARGIEPGLPLSAARVLVPELVVYAQDPVAEVEVLTQLAIWAYRFSSLVSLEPPDALLLEVQGSFALFGGPHSLQQRVNDGLAGLAYRARSASAPTPLAALWMARAGEEVHLLNPGGLAGAVGRLPLRVTGLSDEALGRLRGMGLRRIGDCMRLPRDGLSRRFGPRLVQDLDRALGRSPDPREPFTPPSRFDRRLVLPAEVETTGALVFALRRLVLSLCGWLLGQGKGVGRVRLLLGHRQRPPTRLSIGLLTPTREAGHLLEVMGEHLERLALEAAVDELRLTAEEVEELGGEHQDLFGQQAPQALDWTRLVERLQARLGRDAVRGLTVAADHRPEYAWRSCRPGKGATVVSGLPPRPIWLLSTPMPLAVREGWPWLDGRLQLQRSRERLEGGWWQGEDMARDYFVARTTKGVRLWVYRNLLGTPGWFLHGFFD